MQEGLIRPDVTSGLINMPTYEYKCERCNKVFEPLLYFPPQAVKRKVRRKNWVARALSVILVLLKKTKKLNIPLA